MIRASAMTLLEPIVLFGSHQALSGVSLLFYAS